nr:swi/snf chromatin-remodeling complex subunit snf5 [Quercus suber]
MSDTAGTNTDGKDAIREGKQKAKQVMAASGVDPDVFPAQGQSANMANGVGLPNGTPQLSRKRSRDGTLLPLSTGTNSEEPRSSGPAESHDQILLDRYSQRDMIHGAALNDQAERSRELIKAKEMEKEFYITQLKHQRSTNPGSVFGYGFLGYGNRLTEGKTQIVYNTSRAPPKGRRNRQIYSSRKDNQQQSEQHEELVPVRLDIELDRLRLRDTFTWNLHERLISQDTFADYLLEDLRIPHDVYPEVSRQVKAEMQDQILNYYPHIIVEDGPLEPDRPYSDHKDDEMRIQIKLNITIGRISLVDQFEWDINNPLNSPEEFARQMAWENALSGEFTTAIAHSIREQSQLFTKSLYLTNHCFDGRPIEDPELKDGFLPAPIHSAFRAPHTQKDWIPYMYEMSEAEQGQQETSMMREHRAQKRQLNRRGGPALPDLKDRQRTVRSLIVHHVIPGAVETFETTGIPKTRRSGKPSRRPGARIEGDAESDEMDSEESGAESPLPSAANAGTARTRGMRGAASAAQIAMRQTYGRSATPDAMMLTPQESRVSGRRSMLRDESIAADGGEQLIVKLRIGKAKLRNWLEQYGEKKRASAFPLSGYASQPPVANVTATPNRGGGNASAPPPSTRNTSRSNGHQRTTSSTRGSSTQYDAQGRTETDHWPHPDDTPVS